MPHFPVSAAAWFGTEGLGYGTRGYGSREMEPSTQNPSLLLHFQMLCLRASWFHRLFRALGITHSEWLRGEGFRASSSIPTWLLHEKAWD